MYPVMLPKSAFLYKKRPLLFRAGGEKGASYSDVYLSVICKIEQESGI